LIAHGTSFFLKNKFGRGYYLTLAKAVSPSNYLIQNDDAKSEILLSKMNDNQVIRTDDNDNYLKSSIKASENDEKMPLESNMTLQETNIHKFVKKWIKNAHLVENIGTEMTYSISNKIEYTQNYESFFEQLEINKDSLGNFFLYFRFFLLNITSF
jgi:hypothetical protein